MGSDLKIRKNCSFTSESLYFDDLVQAGEVDFKKHTTEELLARFIVAYFPNVFVKKDLFLDYMGDRIPRELMPRDPNENRFTRGREGGGRDSRDSRDGGGYRGGGNRRFDRGPRRDSWDQDRGPRAERSEGGNAGGGRRFGASSDRGPRPERNERPTEQRASYADRPQRSERSSDRSERSFDRPERSERSAAERAPRSERSERAPRADHPGITRFRGPKRKSRDH